MGSNHLRVERLATRCGQGACFAIGFLLTALFFSVMFWIVWCYLGLSIVQVSDTQRRAIVNYSYTTPSTTPPPPSRATKVPPAVESSANSISRSASPATTTAARVHGRGESSPLVTNKEKDHVATLAKGDFADRNRANVTGRAPDGVRIANSQGVSTVSPRVEEEVKTASILTGANKEDEGILPRRVSTSAAANQPTREDGKKDPTLNSPPAQSQDDSKSRPRKDDSVIDSGKPAPRDYPDSGRSVAREDDLQSSRRSDPAYRDPDFERDYPRPPVSRDRGRYDDDDLTGSRGRYDKRDRGRDTDDRFSKGDTRVYPDDVDRRRPADDRYSDRRPEDDDRYPPRDRYDQRRRGDDDERPRDRDDSRRRDDGSRSDPYPDRSRDTAYDVKRPLDKDYDDRYRSRDDEERYRERDGDRRYVERDDEYRYRPRDDERRYDDRKRDQDYRTPVSGSRVPDLPPADRIPLRSNSSSRDDDYVPDRRDPVDDRYDDRRPPSRYDDRDRDRISPTRVRDEYDGSKSSTFDSRDDRTRERVPSRSYDRYAPPEDDRRYPDDRGRDDGYYRDDEKRKVSSRLISPSSVVESGYSRRDFDDKEYRTRLPEDREYRPRPSDDREYRTRLPEDRERPRSSDDKEYRTRLSEDREYRRRPSDDRDYRTRLPEDREYRPIYSDDREYLPRSPDDRKSENRKMDRKDDVILDRRSYGSEEDRVRSDDSKTKTSYDERIGEDKYVRRIRPGDEEYVRRSDDEYRRSRPRGDYDTDRPRRREDYDDSRSPGKYDRPVEDRRRDSDDIAPKRESPPPRYSSTDSKDRRYRPEDVDDGPPRPSSSNRDVYDDRPLRSSPSQRDVIDDRPHRSSPKDYIDDIPPRTTRRDPLTISAMSPDTSRASGSDGVSRENRYRPSEDREMRPLSPQDVIEAAQRHQDAQGSNTRKVFYPVFDPKVSNLTSPELIRDSERRGITLASRRRRRRTLKR